MDTRNLICISCPLGCPINVTLNESGEIVSVEGNTCPRGEAYARKEVINPTRIVTSTVRVLGSVNGNVTVSCKTKTDVPKGKIYDVIKDIIGITVTAPVHIGDVIKHNIAGTDIDMVATKEVF